MGLLVSGAGVGFGGAMVATDPSATDPMGVGVGWVIHPVRRRQDAYGNTRRQRCLGSNGDFVMVRWGEAGSIE